MSLKLKARGRSLAVMLVSLMIASSIAFVGGVAAYDADSGEFSEEVTIGEDSVEVFADIHADEFEDTDTADESGNFDVDVTYTGLNSSDDDLDGTELHTETVNVASEDTVSSAYEVADTDADDYEDVEVVVEVVDEGNSDLIESVEAGTLEQNFGGGGGSLSLDGEILGFPAVVVLGVLAVTGLVMMRDD